MSNRSTRLAPPLVGITDGLLFQAVARLQLALAALVHTQLAEGMVPSCTRYRLLPTVFKYQFPSGPLTRKLLVSRLKLLTDSDPKVAIGSEYAAVAL